MNNFRHIWNAVRTDVFRAAILALLAVLLWCLFYNRWTTETWSLPLVYPVTPDNVQLERGDVMLFYAQVRAARDGHFTPFTFKNVPELGAPFDGNWNDFPITEYFQYYLPGLLARWVGVFAAVNFMIMVEFVLAALAFYAACRLTRCEWVWSFAGALIFAFARYGFAHGAHHISCTYFWHIPLCMLVCRWIFTGEKMGFRDWRFAFALCVAFATGVQSPYYTNMFAQFVLFGALVQLWRTRDWRSAVPAAAVLAMAGGSFFLMNMGTFVYHMLHGSNGSAVVRAYQWLEFYSLKFVDMAMPPPDHRFPPFAAWAASHLNMGDLRLSPGELPPTAYIGLAGMVGLGWLTLVSLRRVVERSIALPMEAWLVLWIMLYSDAGGINGLLGTLGMQLFRATTRYSIFILCIVLMYLVRRLSALDLKSKPWALPWIYPAATVAVLIALWDQTPPIIATHSDPPQVTDLEETAREVASDRGFVQKMEQRLPANAMIFQVPVMDFPESPYPNVASYDHFRPYLYSRQLRFSFGSDKGRPREKWQLAVAQSTTMGDFIKRLERYGFAGLYVNRNAYPDRGQSILRALQAIGYDDVIDSDNEDVFCVVLKPSLFPEKPQVFGDTSN